MRSAATQARALLRLEEWCAQDPFHRHFRIEWRGPVTTTPFTWRGGWTVLIWSTRRRAPVHPILKVRVRNYKMFMKTGMNLYHTAVEALSEYSK